MKGRWAQVLWFRRGLMLVQDYHDNVPVGPPRYLSPGPRKPKLARMRRLYRARKR